MTVIPIRSENDAQTNTITNKIILCINGRDEYLNYSDFGLSFDSTDEQILTSLQPYIQESFSEDIKLNGSWLYKTRKAVSSQNIYVIPNSTAG